MAFLAAIRGFLFECGHKFDEMGRTCLAVEEEMDVIGHCIASDSPELVASGGSNQSSTMSGPRSRSTISGDR